jgi:nucleotide-binding universal stress UspA family protein
MSRAILHATDFSPASQPAFAKAVDMARRDHAPLLITHVMASVMPMMAGDGYISPATWDAIAKGYRKTSQKKLDALVRRAKGAGVRARGLLLEGTPAADAIVRAARGRHAGSIVLGTHGRSGVARVLLGSVASRVVATARCPVTTVRGR